VRGRLSRFHVRLLSFPTACCVATRRCWGHSFRAKLGCPRSVGLLLLGLLLLTARGLLGLLEHLVYVLCQPQILS
jgi:hypothetical protein